MDLLNFPFVAMLAFIFDIDGTLVDSNELHVDSWDRAFRRFGKQFPGKNYAPRSAKGPTNIYPSFLRRTRSTVSAKSWMIIGPICSKKNISQRCGRFRKCGNFFSESVTTTNASCSRVPVKRLTRNITSTFLRLTISLKVTLP